MGFGELDMINYDFMIGNVIIFLLFKFFFIKVTIFNIISSLIILFMNQSINFIVRLLVIGLYGIDFH